MLALKDRARQLNTTMSRLMAYGEANDEIVSRTHRLTLGLLRSHSVADAVAALEASLAREELVRPRLERTLQGRRLLFVSRQLIHSVLLCSFAHRVTGDPAFLERARRERAA